nr:hypothetical protein [Streptomyces purpureus]
MTRAMGAEGAGHLVGAGVELGVAERPGSRGGGDGGPAGGAGGLFGDEPVDGSPVGVRDVLALPRLGEVLVLGLVEEGQRDGGPLGPLGAGPDEGEDVPGHRGEGEVLVEDVEGAVEVDADVGVVLEGVDHHGQGVLGVHGRLDGGFPHKAGQRGGAGEAQVGDGDIEQPAVSGRAGGQLAQQVAEGEALVRAQGVGGGADLGGELVQGGVGGHRDPGRQAVGDLADRRQLPRSAPVEEGHADHGLVAAVDPGEVGGEGGGEEGEGGAAALADPSHQIGLDGEAVPGAAAGAVGGGRGRR